MPEVPQLIYVHDPMCSWCWGFRPVFAVLCEALARRRIGVTRLLGGLAPDSDAPMPEAMQHQLQQTWQRIRRRIPGTTFNFDFWKDCAPRRSTWPACRAVIAARALEPLAENRMIAAIQRAYYLEARNPSNDTTLIALADEIGLDTVAFARRLAAPDTQATLTAEIAESRRLGAVGFPSLLLQTRDGLWPVPIDYTDPATMIETVDRLAAS